MEKKTILIICAILLAGLVSIGLISGKAEALESNRSFQQLPDKFLHENLVGESSKFLNMLTFLYFLLFLESACQ